MLDIFSLIKRPLRTEKSTLCEKQNYYTFEVFPHASKKNIASAFFRLFKVSVSSVTVMNRKGKKKYFKGRVGYRSSKKIARILIDGTLNFQQFMKQFKGIK